MGFSFSPFLSSAFHEGWRQAHVSRAGVVGLCSNREHNLFSGAMEKGGGVLPSLFSGILNLTLLDRDPSIPDSVALCRGRLMSVEHPGGQEIWAESPEHKRKKRHSCPWATESGGDHDLLSLPSLPATGSRAGFTEKPTR